MFARFFLVVALALVVGFGVSEVFEQGNNIWSASQSGKQLDAALDNHQESTGSRRWYDNPSTIGLVAGGTVFVIGVIVVVAMRPQAAEDGERRPQDVP